MSEESPSPLGAPRGGKPEGTFYLTKTDEEFAETFEKGSLAHDGDIE